MKPPVNVPKRNLESPVSCMPHKSNPENDYLVARKERRPDNQNCAKATVDQRTIYVYVK